MATVTPADQTSITHLYIGLFNRAPDTSGLDFWAQALANGATIDTITRGFLGSPEAQTIYAPTQTAEQFVSTFYQTVFGRAADASGLNFWTSVLTSAGGVNSQAAKSLLVTKIIEIVSQPLSTKPNDLNDAQYAETVKDRDIFSKKTVLAIDFAVNQKGTDLTMAKQAIVFGNTPGTGTAPAASQVIALTVGNDTKNGDSGDDTFNAPAGTLQDGDNLDGSSGTDTLNITGAGSGTFTPTLRNIEIVNLRAADGGTTIDLALSTGVTHVNIVGGTSSNNGFSNVGNAALSVADQNGSVRFSGSTATALSLNLKNVGSAGSSTNIDLAYNAAAAATTHAIVAENAHIAFSETTASTPVTGITVAATGNNTLKLSTAEAANVQTLAVTGAGAVDFSGASLSTLTTFTAGDGGFKLTSTNTTADALDITTGAGVDTIVANGASIKTLNVGAGNDVVTFNTGELSSAAKVNLGDGDDVLNLDKATNAEIDGGAGKDILNITAAGSGTFTPTLRGIEIVSLTSAAGGTVIDLGSSTGVNQVKVVGGTGSNNGFINVGNAALSVADQNGGVRFSGSTATALALNLKNVGSAGSSVSVDLAYAVAAAATTHAIVAENAHIAFSETVGSASVTGVTIAATGTNTLKLSANDAASVQTLAVTGTGAVDLSGASFVALTTFTSGDGNVKLTSTNASANVLDITTGAGTDTIVANAASVKTLSTGAGNDVVTLNTGTLADGAKVNLGEGDDTLNLTRATNAEIEGGDGTDTLNITAAGSGTFTPTLRNIEVVNLTSVDGGTIIDLAASSGATKLGVVGNTANGNGFANVGNAALSIADQTGSVRFSGSTAAALSLNLKNVGAAGNLTSVDLAFSAAAAATTHAIVAENAHIAFSETTASTNVTGITVAATGTNTLKLSTAEAANVQTIAVTGAGAVDFSGTSLAALTTFTSGDGNIKFTSNNATADVLDITTGAGTDTIVANAASVKTLNAGAGNDIVTLNVGTLAAGAKVNLGDGDDIINLYKGTNAEIDGGTGNDALNITFADSGTFTPTLRGIETVSLSSGAGGTIIDLGSSTGVNQVKVVGSVGSNNGFANVGNAALSIADQSGSVRFSGSTATALSLSLKNVGAAGNLTGVDLAFSAAAAATTHAIVAENAYAAFSETTTSSLVTNVTVAATGTNTLTLSAADAASVQTIAVTGTGTVDFSGASLAALKTFTSVGGDVKLTATNATNNALQITTGGGADTIVANGTSVKTLNTGAGNDTVTLNTAALNASAVVNLGDGNDTITLSHGSVAGAVINGGDGDDTIITGVVRHAVPASGAVGEVQTLTLGTVTGSPLASADIVSVTLHLPSSTEVTVRVDLTDKVAAATSIANAVTLRNFLGLSTTSSGETVIFTFNDGRTGVDYSPITFNGDKDGGSGTIVGTVVETVKGAPATSGSAGSLDTLNGGAGSDTFVFTTPDVDSVGGAITAIIQDFQIGVDKIRVTNAGDGAGSATNFQKAGAAAGDLATLLTAADTALTGAIKYYVGQVGSDAYLVTDANGAGYTNVIKLAGVALSGVDYTDLIA